MSYRTNPAAPEFGAAHSPPAAHAAGLRRLRDALARRVVDFLLSEAASEAAAVAGFAGLCAVIVFGCIALGGR